MIVNLKLIRHGKTQASVEHKYCGSTNLSLCNEGISEIEDYIKSGYYQEPITTYFTSGMKRADETLQLIYGNVKYEIIDELKEMCFGDFEMRSYDEMVNDEKYIKWIEDTTGDYVCPNGESTNEFYARVEKGFEKLFKILAENEITDAVVVAHGGTLGYFAREYLDKNMPFYDSMPKQARGYNTVFDIENKSLKVIKWEKF